MDACGETTGVVPGLVVPQDAVRWFPVGWMRVAAPYGAGRWWVLLVPLAIAVAAVAVTYVVAGRRELGAGLLRDRAGTGGPVRGRLRGTAGLAWRLHGGRVVSWVTALGPSSPSARPRSPGGICSPERKRKYDGRLRLGFTRNNPALE